MNIKPPTEDRPAGSASAVEQETHEQRQSLWMLISSPLIWSVHFLASYLTAAIWCTKVVQQEGDSLLGARVAIGVYTAIALTAIGLIGWRSLRRYRLRSETSGYDFDTPEDRHRFLGFATFILSGLSAVATIFVALAAVFVESCQ